MKDILWFILRRSVRGTASALPRLWLLFSARLAPGSIGRHSRAPGRGRRSNGPLEALIGAIGRTYGGLDWNRRPLVIRWAFVAAAFVVTQPLISILHEAAVLLAAVTLNWSASTPLLKWAAKTVVADPIYSRIALELLGNIHARGLAVSGLLGDLLHSIWPSVFVESSLVLSGSWVSAVTASGSSVVSQFLAVASADGLLVLCGALLVRRGLRGESLRRAFNNPSLIDGQVLFGLLLQARGVLAILSIEMTQMDLENLGLAQVGTKLLIISHQSYETIVSAFGGLLSFGLHLLVVLAVYAAALIFGRLLPAPDDQRQSSPVSARVSIERSRPRLLSLLPVAGLFLVSLSPFGVAASNFSGGEAETTESVARTIVAVRKASGDVEAAAKVDVQVARPNKADEVNPVAPPPVATPTPTPGPSYVTITKESNNFAYFVNGRRTSVRGVGYNVIYRHLPNERRARRYERDFARMADARINTILGWGADQGYDHDKFDELLLSKASKFGLGVLMPYYLDPNGDYSSDEYRARLAKDVVDWVRRFKHYSAVRMWAIGNEVMHGMEAMVVLRGQKPQSNPDAFVDFYLKVVDEVHKEDPNHPVIYRTAEDTFLRPFAAVRPRGVETRPWLVFGMNIFSSRLKAILAQWERDGFDNPLLISEFGPTGLSRQERPRGFVRMWQAIRSHPCSVIGGIVYVWTTSGPEPVDRVFGLVDGDGNAVDGSLDAIGSEFRQDSTEPRSCRTSTTGPH